MDKRHEQTFIQNEHKYVKNKWKIYSESLPTGKTII